MSRPTAGNTKTAGTQESARELSVSRRYAAGLRQEIDSSEMPELLGLSENGVAWITDAFFRVMAREGDRLHWKAPVCTNCEREVDEENFEARGRLDTLHTESAQRMIDQAQAEAGAFRAELESRGVKI